MRLLYLLKSIFNLELGQYLCANKFTCYVSGYLTKLRLNTSILLILFLFIPFLASADGLLSFNGPSVLGGQYLPRPHVPIGVFIAEMPAPKSVVFAVAPVYSESSSMLIGDRSISPQEVVATTPWFFYPKYSDRVTPQYKNTFNQNGTVHYGITNDLSIALSASYVHNFISSLAFKGSDGIIPLGKSFTETGGISDLTSTAVLRLYEDKINKITINLGAGYPVGSSTANINMLRSTGLYVDSRANYGLQPASRTYSFLPGLQYTGFLGPLSWGLAYRGRIYLFDNYEGWRPGSLNQFNGWVAYNITPDIEPTLRIVSNSSSRVRGFDPKMKTTTPGSDPKFNGGQQLEIYGGSIISGQLIGIDRLDVATEIGLPFYQTLNGPQLKKNWQGAVQLRYRY